MTEPKNKLLLFSLGISIGLLIGGAFMFFQMKDNEQSHVNENAIERIANKVYNLISLNKKEIPYKEIEKPEPNFTALQNQPKKNLTDSSNYFKKDINKAALRTDTLAADSVKENLTKESLRGTPGFEEAEIIVVKKDEIISSKMIDVIHADAESKIKKQSSADSILSVVSGIKDDKSIADKTQIKVEFWKSPINYKGYKMNRNKIILFGLDPALSMSIHSYQEQTFLKYQQNIYRLETANDFKAFEKVINPSVIEKLK